MFAGRSGLLGRSRGRGELGCELGKSRVQLAGVGEQGLDEPRFEVDGSNGGGLGDALATAAVPPNANATAAVRTIGDRIMPGW